MKQISNTRVYVLKVILLYILINNPTVAQITDYNHPELKWQTIETEHYAVHFYPGTERTARLVAGIAEEIYKPITDLYDYRPDGKIHWVIRDHDDYSNGAAYYYENKIEIWSKPLDFEFRGTHHWLYDVVTHEFTHMIQLGASRKGPRWMPAIYFQYINYEPEKRPDVLYGYPNRIASFPVAMTIIPMWFAEGTAQFQTRELGHDWWDSHRDMMLRVRALDDKLLTYNEMGVFGKTSLGAESVYNHGYALVRYIADRWGDQALRDLSRSSKHLSMFTFDGSIKRILGISGQELYDQWTTETKQSYNTKTATIRDNTVTGTIVHDKGFGNLYPVFSHDGKQVAFQSNKGRDYLSLGRLFIKDIEKDSLIDPKSPVKGVFDWSDDGRYFLYSRKSGPNRVGSHYNDLYLWNRVTEKDVRLTRDARLATPTFSPDGKQAIAVHNSDGTHNLAIVNLPEKIIDRKDLSSVVTWELLTHFDDGTQIYNPKFNPNGTRIYCATTNLGSRDIYCFDLENETWDAVIDDSSDSRNVTVTPDGKALIFADDRTGIYNLYRYDQESGETTPITNVVGGAFMPSISGDGRIAYSEFTVDGYSIRLLDTPGSVLTSHTTYLEEHELERPNLRPPPRLDAPAGSYSSPFNKLFILPRIAWDYGTFKPGIYAYTGDLLDKLTLFGGAAIGNRGERDFYLSAEYRVLYPTLFLEAFNVVRSNSESFDDTWVIVGEKEVDSLVVPIYGQYSVDYRFNLLEFDMGARLPIKDDYIASAIFRLSDYKAALKFDDGGSFDYKYFKGRSYILRIDSDQRALSVASDIHPKGGWRGWLEYARENNRFLDGFEVEAEKGTIVEVYKPYNYHRVETDIDYYMPLGADWVLNPRLIAGSLSKPVDSFFHLYAGGLTGLRGYSYYSIGGNNKLVGRLSLRTPISTGIDFRWGPFYLDRIHGALFAEAGDAWSGSINIDEIKKDLGAELRIKLFSWYGFPTDIQFTGAYSLDRFVIDSEAGRHEYGREWRWYFTLLFDFI